jgi:hypothetical protein
MKTSPFITALRIIIWGNTLAEHEHSFKWQSRDHGTNHPSGKLHNLEIQLTLPFNVILMATRDK